MDDTEKNTAAMKYTEYRNVGMLVMVLTAYCYGPKFLNYKLRLPRTKIVFTPREILSTKPRKLDAAIDMREFFLLCEECDLDILLIYIENILRKDLYPVQSPWAWQYLLLKYTVITGVFYTIGIIMLCGVFISMRVSSSKYLRTNRHGVYAFVLYRRGYLFSPVHDHAIFFDMEMG